MVISINNDPVSKVSKMWRTHIQTVTEYLVKKGIVKSEDVNVDIRISQLNEGYGLSFYVVFSVPSQFSSKYRTTVFHMAWKISSTPSCCAFPLLHTFSHSTLPNNGIYDNLVWIVQTLNAIYWMDLGGDHTELEDWEYYDEDYDDEELQHCVQMNLIENYYPFWHWYAKEYGNVEGSFEVYNHNSGNQVEVVVTRFS